MKAHCLRLLALSSFSVLGACADDVAGPKGPLTVTIAPLQLPDVLEVCYQLEVFNDDDETVWSNDDVCSSQYGNAGGGDVTYIGPCDAQVNDNYVTLVLDTVEDVNNDILNDQESGVADPDFVNPCPASSPCELTFECIENADVLVAFNLTIMRDADQGFFDIVVNFDDIFCSGKEDTCYSPGKPIELLFGNDVKDGPGRDETAVIGIACSAGPDTNTEDIETELLLTQVVLTCQDGNGPITFSLNPTGTDAGNQIGKDTTERYKVEWSLYTGIEELNCGVGSVHAQDRDGFYLYGERGEYYAKYNPNDGLWILYDSATGQDAAEKVPGSASTPPASFGKVGDQQFFPFMEAGDLSCNKKYTNIAINLENLIGQGLKSCKLTYGATAKEVGDTETFVYGQATGKPGTTYAVFGGKDIPLFSEGKVDCHHNPLNGVGFDGKPSLVQAGYMGQITGLLPQFCYSYVDGQLKPVDMRVRHATMEEARPAGAIYERAKTTIRFANIGEQYAKLCGSKAIIRSQYVELALGTNLGKVNLEFNARDYTGKYMDSIESYAYLQRADQYEMVGNFQKDFLKSGKGEIAVTEGSEALILGFTTTINEAILDADEAFKVDLIGVGRQ